MGNTLQIHAQIVKDVSQRLDSMQWTEPRDIRHDVEFESQDAAQKILRLPTKLLSLSGHTSQLINAWPALSDGSRKIVLYWLIKQNFHFFFGNWSLITFVLDRVFITGDLVKMKDALDTHDLTIVSRWMEFLDETHPEKRLLDREQIALLMAELA